MRCSCSMMISPDILPRWESTLSSYNRFDSALENLVGQQKAQAIKVVSEKLWWFGDQLGRLIERVRAFLETR